MARDIAIVGGGIIGLTCAYALARRGADVAVFDGGEFGMQASWAGAGIVPPGNPRWAATPADWLRAYSAATFDAVSADLRDRTGIDNGYRKCGGIEFLTPADADVFEVWNAERIRYGPFDPHREPGLRTHGDAPVFLPDCGQVRNPWHLRALIAACRVLDVELRPMTAVAGFTTHGDSVTGVTLSNGPTESCGRVLLCPGAWAKGLLSQLHCELEVVPVRGQIAALRAEVNALHSVVMVGKRYLVPRGDGIVLIGSSEEPEAGFVTGTTPEVVAGLRAFAELLVPDLGRAELLKAWSGLRPGTPDGLPYLGRVPGWQNAFAATGHFRSGVQTSLGTAEVMARCLLQGIDPDPCFALDRTPATNLRPAFRS